MNIVKTVTKRTIALIVLRVSGTLAGGSIAGVELWQSALLAAFIGVMDVAESLSRAYVVDGDLSEDEINRSFASSAEAELSATAHSVVVPAAAAVATYQVSQADLNSFANDDEEDEEEEYTEK